MWALVAAALWGLAEATFFFLVPDVILSAIAIHDWRLALWACVAATAGALAGGAFMYAAGHLRHEAVRSFLLRIPGIGPAMLTRVADEIDRRGFLAVLLGPLSGTPYKAYAVECGRRHLSAGAFLAISVPARIIRFAAVTALAAWLAHAVFPSLPTSGKFATWALAWTGFYAWYFRAMHRRG